MSPDPVRRILPLLLLASACSRELGLPPLPGPGTLQGRVVYGVPGQRDLAVGAGARVTVLGTSLGALAGPSGLFLVSGITQSTGKLLVQVDLDHDGTPDRQTLIDLQDVHAGAGRDVVLGDVVVVENARVHGRVHRADVPSPTTGQGGTVVFVPEGPFLTYTGDDGSFLLDQLPEGRISFTFFRDGYDPAGVDGIDLRAGEDFALRDVTLTPSAPPAGGGTPPPGTIAGHVSFSPAASLVATVSAFPLSGTTLTQDASASGDFSIGAAAGLYRVEVAASGYATAVVSNVMVGSGQTVQVAVVLSQGGVSAPPPPPVTPVTCVAGAACQLPNACQVGQVTCVAGAPFCASIGNALDGIPCGANQICQAGACIPVCVSGAACQPANDPCRDGTVTCGGGTPACAPAATTRPDGTPCGLDQVCLAGACSPCAANQVCQPADPCHSGLTSCATGTQACVDTGLPLADGASCGSGLYCSLGVCGACQPGTACTPGGFPCHGGATSCATGRSVCVDTGQLVADGTSCGTSQVCRTGSCNACAAGASCVPAASACHAGAISCGTGLPVCVDQQTNLAPGSSCGAGQVCDGAGACVACAAGQACTPANPCHAGAIGCGTGAPVCGDTGTALANGTGCGTNLVCGGGTCNPCTAGQACAPPNPCHRGATSCSTGTPVCQDSSVQVADGTGCGTDQVCFGGTCGACAVGAACDGAAGHAAPPASPNPCLTYATACGTGLPACAPSGQVADGTACGGSNVCRSGVCTAPGFAIQVVSGDQQHGLPNQPLAPVVLKVVDAGGAPQSGVGVAVSAPPGAQGSVSTPGGKTLADGTVQLALTLGRAVGPQSFAASSPSAFSALTIAATADPLPAGTVIPIVNAAHVAGNAGIGGPAPAAQLSNPNGIAVSASGDVYVSDQSNHVVKRVSPAGVLSVVAGTPGSAGFGGDGGPATGTGSAARLNNPAGLALFEGGPYPRLLIADQYNHRIREVNLSTNVITTFAGDGTSGTDPFGDGLVATQAQLFYPGAVAFGPERPVPSVWVADAYHYRLRRIDGTTGIVSTPLAQGNCTTGLALSNVGSPGGSALARMAFDSKGSLFLSAYFCESGLSFYGVARLAPDGTLTRVAGKNAGGLAGGQAALNVGFPAPPGIALDGAVDGTGTPRENLHVAAATSQVVARIDSPSGRLDLTGGSIGSPGGTGDFGPATAALFSNPVDFAFAPGTRDLYLVDYGNDAVRMVAGAGSASASSATLAAAGPTAQTAYVDQLPPMPLQAKLVDGAGNALIQYPVSWALDPAGLPGGWIPSGVADTQPSGVSATSARPGLSPGGHGFIASYRDIHGDHIPGSPLAFSVTAVAPPAGTGFTAVNDDHVSAFSGIPGPGATAHLYEPFGAAAASDGSVYFGIWSAFRVLKMDRYGLVTVVGGNGSSGYQGDGGPATGAGFQPYAVALAEGLGPAGTLFVADGGNHRVRKIDLASGVVTTLYGDGTATPMYYAYRVRYVGGSVYVSDYYGVVRKIDPVTGAAAAFLQPYATNAFVAPPTGAACGAGNGPPARFTGCNSSQGCDVALDAAGNLFLAAQAAGQHNVGYVDAASGTYVSLSGGQTAPAPGDYTPTSSTAYLMPHSISLGPGGHLWITDQGTGVYALRVVW